MSNQLAEALRLAYEALMSSQPTDEDFWPELFTARRAARAALAAHEAAKPSQDVAIANHKGGGVIYKTSEAATDAAIRAKMIELGWTPPHEAAKPAEPVAGLHFRKKPVVIEAMQWDGSWDSLEAIKAKFPAMEVGATTLHPPSKKIYSWSVRTLEGSHQVSVGDWIIKGVKGEFYPCKSDIFAMTYDPAASPVAEAAKPAEPVAEVKLMEAGGNVGISTVIREIDNPMRERLQPGDKLYAAPVAVASPWQPIESAPKDGSSVLTFRLLNGEPQICDARYFALGCAWGQRSWRYPAETGPTHWMPLPPAPKEQA